MKHTAARQISAGTPATKKAPTKKRAANKALVEQVATKNAVATASTRRTKKSVGKL